MPGVPQDEREMLVERQPNLFYFTDHYKDYPMLLIRLSKARRGIVEPLLRRQWRSLASKKALGTGLILMASSPQVCGMWVRAKAVRPDMR